MAPNVMLNNVLSMELFMNKNTILSIMFTAIIAGTVFSGTSVFALGEGGSPPKDDPYARLIELCKQEYEICMEGCRQKPLPQQDACMAGCGTDARACFRRILDHLR